MMGVQLFWPLTIIGMGIREQLQPHRLAACWLATLPSRPRALHC
jgi:hypothetical protein